MLDLEDEQKMRGGTSPKRPQSPTTLKFSGGRVRPVEDAELRSVSPTSKKRIHAAIEASWEQEARRLFAEGDLNQNSSLSKTELKKHLHRLDWADAYIHGEGFHWKALWDGYDTNEDGTISLEEFLLFYECTLLPIQMEWEVRKQKVKLKLEGNSPSKLTNSLIKPHPHASNLPALAEMDAIRPRSKPWSHPLTSQTPRPKLHPNMNSSIGRHNPFEGVISPTSPGLTGTKGASSRATSSRGSASTIDEDIKLARLAYTEAGGEGAENMSASAIVKVLLKCKT